MNQGLLAGKTAIVTGGVRGIGRAIALRFVAEGANVLATFFSDGEAAKETAAIAGGLPGRLITFQGDVGDPLQATAAVSAAKEAFGGLHILVNNAGITRDKLLLRMKPEDFDNVIRTNLSGAFYMMQAATPILIRNGESGGRIINISSVVGLRGNPAQVNYAAAKAGVIGMTLSAAKELGQRGVTVNAIAPGYIETDMTAVLTDTQREQILSAISLKRPGQPEDVAAAAVFFAAHSGSYITGQVLSVDGGMSI